MPKVVKTYNYKGYTIHKTVPNNCCLWSPTKIGLFSAQSRFLGIHSSLAQAKREAGIDLELSPLREKLGPI